MKEKIKEAIKRIDELSKKKRLKIISHFDTDGICSAGIFSRALERGVKHFSLEVVSSLEDKFIRELGDEEVLIFLDLGSGCLESLEKKKTEVFVFDHHEIPETRRGKIPENVFIVNPVLHDTEKISAAAVCYLFAKELDVHNKDLANLAVIGMVGDLQEKNIGKVFSEILEDSGSVVKKGPLLYPSTRPLDRALEYSSSFYIPGVSASREGVLELLRDAKLFSENGKYKALYELNGDEMQRLVTAILLRSENGLDEEEIVGNLFLVKFFNKLEDARELSALINACGRMSYAEVALGFCLGNKNFREEAEKVYISYRQSLVSALRFVSGIKKTRDDSYIIINAGENIKDTIIGTITSIVSHSPLYKLGTVVIGMADKEEKIKVSARLVGREGKNVREVLTKACAGLNAEVGGHPEAAGCLIAREKEEEFLTQLKKVLDVEVVRV